VFVLTLPFDDSPLGIIAFTPDEIFAMATGEEPPMINFSDNFAIGAPLPQLIQVMIGTQEEVLVRVKKACEAIGVGFEPERIVGIPNPGPEEEGEKP
jgi:hypothetical protein